MSPIFRNLGKIPEETAHVLQNLVGAKGLNMVASNLCQYKNRRQIRTDESHLRHVSGRFAACGV